MIDFEIISQSCFQHDQLSFTHPLQHVDCKGHRMYPVSLSKNKTRMIIVPHDNHENAQYLISATYQALQDQLFDTIIMISQADSTAFHGVALPFIGGDNYSFKGFPVAIAKLETLLHGRLFYFYQKPFCNNVGLQLQFDLLHFYGKKVAVIPLLVGKISQAEALQIAEAIARCCGDQTLIVISVDIAYHKNLTHDRPLDQTKICKVYDRDACRIQAIQSRALQQHVNVFDDGCIASVFSIFFQLLQLPAFKNIESYFVGYGTSHSFMDTSARNMEDVHTYGAFILQDSTVGYKNNIGLYEQSQLLQCARSGLESLFGVFLQPRIPCMISYEMIQPYGAFASLYTMSDHGTVLRGCMGKVQSNLVLHDMVHQVVWQAACKDLRFSQIRQKELASTIISLSVIIDFKRVHHYEEICEQDGIFLQYDEKTAITLPSMNFTQSWNYESKLTDLSNQIELHSFLWKKPRAKIFTFGALTFQEE